MEKPNLEMQLFHPVEPDAEDCRKWQVTEEYRCNVVSSFEWTHGMCGCLALLLYCLTSACLPLPRLPQAWRVTLPQIASRE